MFLLVFIVRKKREIDIVKLQDEVSKLSVELAGERAAFSHAEGEIASLKDLSKEQANKVFR